MSLEPVSRLKKLALCAPAKKMTRNMKWAKYYVAQAGAHWKGRKEIKHNLHCLYTFIIEIPSCHPYWVLVQVTWTSDLWSCKPDRLLHAFLTACFLLCRDSDARTEQMWWSEWQEGREGIWSGLNYAIRAGELTHKRMGKERENILPMTGNAARTRTEQDNESDSGGIKVNNYSALFEQCS